MGQGIQIVGINLLEELDQLSIDSRTFDFRVAFFLTYTLNLQFFEQLVLPRIRRIGVSSIGILADYRAYQDSLRCPSLPEKCGRNYILGYSPWLQTLQHGKIIWLHGDRDIVFVGSHNLTRAGFNDQLEVTMYLDSLNLSHLSAIKDAHRAISRLLQGSSELLRIWQMIPEPTGNSTELDAYFLWSGNNSLLSQLISIIGVSEKMRVITPFLDAIALRELSNQLSAKNVVLDLPFEGADTPLYDAVKIVPNLTPRTITKPKRLHAKAYEFKNKNVNWLAIGSANCTRSGLLKTIDQGGNSEFLALFADSSLQDEDLEFENVGNATDLPGTGRRWDESGLVYRGGIKYFNAVYENKTLYIFWECDGQIEKPCAIVGDDRLELSGSPAFLTLEHSPPQSIDLTGKLNNKEILVKAWVIFPEELTAYAAGINIPRRRYSLESDDPIEQSLGIEFEILKLLQDFKVSDNSSVLPTVGAAPQLRTEDVDEAINIFEFSHDPVEITRRAVSLVIGNQTTDPLATIRGLIAKIAGPPPYNAETDEESMESYTSRQEHAMRSSSNMLINHLRRLAGIGRKEWHATPRERIQSCLQITFEAAVLIWWKVIFREQTQCEQFTQKMLEFIRILANNEYLTQICKEISVASPLILAIGVAAEGTTDENERKLLREYLIRLASSDYRKVIKNWFGNSPIRVSMITRVRGESNTATAIESRLRPVYLLMGLADEQLLWKQKHKWGILIDLVDALTNKSASSRKLFEEAELHYKDDLVWQKCKSCINSDRIPQLLRIKNVTVCEKCYVQLSIKVQNDLKRGEAVLCGNCGTILLFGQLLG
ncbi:MAG: hypothetical protein PHU23_05365 [Dehalococcoidales bacterium]|nr:hypothetical protein [Dehalococcoidales bacterium]